MSAREGGSGGERGERRRTRRPREGRRERDDARGERRTGALIFSNVIFRGADAREEASTPRGDRGHPRRAGTRRPVAPSRSRAVSRLLAPSRAVSLVPGAMGASLSCLCRRGSDEEEDDDLALPGAKKDEEEDAMRGWRYNGGTLTDADAGPVEIVVSRLRTDASRSRVMDDGRDALPSPSTTNARRDTARRPPRVGSPRAARLPPRPRREEISSSTSASARSAGSQAQGAVFPPPVLVRGRRPHARWSSRDRARRRRRRRGTPARGGGRGGAKILGEVRFTLADLLKTNQRRLVRGCP